MAFTKINAAGIGSTETVTLDGLSVINNLTATDGAFSGNVTIGGTLGIGGTLTYEDVTNVDSVGLITARNGIVVGSGITLSKDGDGFFTGIITATFAGDGSSLTGVANTDVIFPDKISFGDGDGVNLGIGSDLRIYHSGSHSYIQEEGTGNLYIDSNQLYLRQADSDTVLLQTTSAGAIQIKHDGNLKFETTNTGAVVTGVLTATSFSGDGSALTGIGGTDFIHSEQINNSGITTSNYFVPTAGQLGGRRNLIINGAMQVNERGTNSDQTGYQTVDRFKNGYGGHDEVLQQYQGTVASHESPYAEGFRYNYYLMNGDQTGGAGTSDYAEIQYKMESQDISQSGWNYTDPNSFITLSFWVKSNVGQNYYGFVYTADGTAQRYIFETGTISANSWNKIIVTIPGNSNITLNNDNGEGLIIKWIPFYGTDLTNNSATVGSWANYNGAARTPDYTSDWWTTNNSTFYITGVQLEVGPVATPFEHRSYAETLQLCRRYYQRLPGLGDHYMFGLARAESNTARTGISVPVPMRAAPTVTCNGSRTFRGDGGYNSESTDSPSIYNSGSWVSSSSIYTIDFPGHSLTHNKAYALMSKTTSANALELDAEL